MKDVQPSMRWLVTESAASKITGLSRSSLRLDREDCRFGGIPFRRFGTGPRRRIRYALEDLTRYLDSRSPEVPAIEVENVVRT